MKLFLISAFLFLLSCSGQKKTMMKNDQKTNTTLQFVLTNNYSGNARSETLVITDVEALKLFYSKVNTTRKQRLPLPVVNFDTDMLLISCGGERNDGSRPIIILKEETATRLVFSLDFQGNQTTKAITKPFSIYKMALTDKAIEFMSAQE